MNLISLEKKNFYLKSGELCENENPIIYRLLYFKFIVNSKKMANEEDFDFLLKIVIIGKAP